MQTYPGMPVPVPVPVIRVAPAVPWSAYEGVGEKLPNKKQLIFSFHFSKVEIASCGFGGAGKPGAGTGAGAGAGYRKTGPPGL